MIFTGYNKNPRKRSVLKGLCFHYTIDEHITAFDFCNLLFRFVFVRNLASRFNQLAHDLIELRGVLGRNDRYAGLLLDGFPCISRDLAAGACNFDVFPQTFRCFLLGDLRSCGFGQHIENQLQRCHIITQILFFQALEIFIPPRVHTGPRFCDLVGQNRVFHTFLNAARVPFVGQLFAYLNGLQALVDPFAAVAFLEIGFQRTVYRQLRVNRFFYALPTNLCKPELLFRKKDYLDL